MNTKIILTALFCYFSIAAFAQPSYQVLETPKVLNKDWHNSFAINLLGVNTNMVATAWAAKMEKAGGELMKSPGDDVVGFKNVSLPKISAQPLQVYSRIYEDSEAAYTHFTVWYQQGEKFISSQNTPTATRPIFRQLLQFSFEMEDELQVQIHQEKIENIQEAFPKVKN